MPPRPRILVIGVGNACQSDDAIGIVSVRRLTPFVPSDVKVLEESGEPADLMEAWSHSSTVILIDAVHSNAKPGSIHRLDAHAQQIPRNIFHCSTHTLGVGHAIELAQMLNALPPRLIVYGIEGKNFAGGTQLSLEVEKAIDKVVELVLKEIRSST